MTSRKSEKDILFRSQNTLHHETVLRILTELKTLLFVSENEKKED